jgi:hypothetical protein
MDSTQQNPLAKHFRQPAIYIKLPSEGRYWPEKSLDMPANKELPVYPMTAKDEILLKTPDSLLNGTTVAQIIQSCLPNIKDAWQMPSCDFDYVLMSIRVASYGHKMDISSECPHCATKNEYTIDLRNIIDSFKQPVPSELITVDDLKFKLKPQPYYSVNKVNMMRFEEERIISQLLDSNIDRKSRLDTFKGQLDQIADLNVEVLADSTEYIQLPDNTVVNQYGFIKEFYANSDSSIIRQVQECFDQTNKSLVDKTLKVTCTNEECLKEYESNLEFDYSRFFVVSS